MEKLPEQNNMENFEGDLEKYKEPYQEMMFVRHGATGYKEQFDKDFDGQKDLKEDGEKQAELAASYIDDFINKEKDIKIFTSPRVRTNNTADIIKSEIENRMPSTVKISKAESLINAKVKEGADEIDIWTKLFNEYQKRDSVSKMNDEYYSGELNERYGDVIESATEQSDRVINSFIKMLRIVRKREKMGKDNENMILVGHNETLNLLLQNYGENLTENDFRIISTGEVAHLQIYPNHVIIKYGEQEYKLNM